MCTSQAPVYPRTVGQLSDAELANLAPSGGSAPAQGLGAAMAKAGYAAPSSSAPAQGLGAAMSQAGYVAPPAESARPSIAQVAQTEIDRRTEIRSQLDRQKQEFASQQEEMDRLQRLQEETQAKQQQVIKDLAAERDTEMSRIAAARAEQEALIVRQQQQQIAALAGQRAAQEAAIAQEQLGTQAVSQSMRVLAMKSAQGTAPTAQQTRGKGVTKVRANAATNDLRIGSSGRSSGVGVNIGG